MSDTPLRPLPRIVHELRMQAVSTSSTGERNLFDNAANVIERCLGDIEKNPLDL